ncbi:MULTISPECIES: MerR family transcriptional regulator [unclassified Knoellia]|uniref:MerR family transcriptional regulator n=1 Tax=Knoellia altitudinis TaxID=3404795 RepID=UPI003610939E
MKIGELARRTGASVRSLRYYEEQGLILSGRTSGGQRVYDEDAVERVDLVQLLFRAGVASRDVVEILPCIYSGTTTPAMVGRLVAERARIDEKVRELTATRNRLDGVVRAARARLATTV